MRETAQGSMRIAYIKAKKPKPPAFFEGMELGSPFNPETYFRMADDELAKYREEKRIANKQLDIAGVCALSAIATSFATELTIILTMPDSSFEKVLGLLPFALFSCISKIARHNAGLHEKKATEHQTLARTINHTAFLLEEQVSPINPNLYKN